MLAKRDRKGDDGKVVKPNDRTSNHRLHWATLGEFFEIAKENDRILEELDKLVSKENDKKEQDKKGGEDEEGEDHSGSENGATFHRVRGEDVENVVKRDGKQKEDPVLKKKRQELVSKVRVLNVLDIPMDGVVFRDPDMLA